MKRCSWCNLNNEKYVIYHDKEWSKLLRKDDRYLFELLVLESFQAGLSWEIVLNKREDFKVAFDDFDIDKISKYDEKKIEELINNKKIIRNKNKITTTINNAKIFLEISKKYHSFYNFLISFIPDRKVIFEDDKTSSALSDNISKVLSSCKMKYVGSKIIYSYLQAIGIISSHEKECFLYLENKDISL